MSVIKLQTYPENIVHNYKTLQRYTPNLAAVVKANGYGLGALSVTETLRKSGCTEFFVANATEGQILRKKFSDITIYVLDGFVEQETILDYQLTPVINTVEQLTSYSHIPNHCDALLHIDTGMNRLGIPMHDITQISQDLLKDAGVQMLLTHFSASEDNPETTNRQTSLILQAGKALNINQFSIANSCGIVRHSKNLPQNNLSRGGIALYGGIQHPDLRPCISMHGKILQKKHLPMNSPIGYNSTYVTDKPTKVITVAGGYADGIMRSLSGSQYCGYVDGHYLPLIGKVSMDTTIFDASNLSDTEFNQVNELEFFGFHNSIVKMADYADTISYEILVNLGRRFSSKITYDY